MPDAKDLKGQKFGRLIVISDSGKRKYGGVLWLCRCECGNEKIIRANHLQAGATKSCGCLYGQHRKTHGMAYTKFYRTWQRIKNRCNNPKSHNYKYYGGRGIKVCERWLKFSNFKDDMYENYLEHQKNNNYTSLDRINNNGNYEPNNCKWADRFVQANNRRDNKI